MKSGISFFNWSLNKLLKDETDSFLKAKYKILFIIFILSFVKGIVAVVTAAYFGQNFQMYRGLLFVVVYLWLFKSFLSKTLSLKVIAHILILGSLVLIYTNLFVTANSVNVVTLQFVFTLILSSFYILNLQSGLFYSSLAIIPILVSLLIGQKFSTNSGLGSLASPGYELIVLVNFVTIVYIPYLFYQAFINTIQEKEELNFKLQDAVKTANEAVKVKSNFLSTMSHELRTPLNTVIGTTDLLLSDTYEPHQAENLKDLKFSANTLLHIINDILDYNKLESSKLTLEAIKVDLAKLLQTVCSGLQKQATEKHINLKLEIEEEINNYDFDTDPTRIAQIVYNLIGNAVKFTSVGEVLVKLTIEKKDTNKITLRFNIKDTGIGINAEKQAAVFEPFSQGSSSITRNFGGTGLGLSIVKRLLSLFDSKINLVSNVHQGSTFYFDIDFKYYPKAEKITKRESLHVLVHKDLSDLRILVAEDNLMNRVLIKKVFAKWKNEPSFAENGQEAIDITSTTKFDVILMDLHMPLVDGYEAAKAIKSAENGLNRETDILAFTASISNEILAEVTASGMVDYIYKPFDPAEMYEKLRNLHPLK